VTTFLQPNDPSSTHTDGGAVELVQALAKDLPKDNLFLNSPVTKCQLVNETTAVDKQQQCQAGEEQQQQQQLVHLKTQDDSYWAKCIIVVVPPKLVFKHMEFDPPLSTTKQQALPPQVILGWQE
jgi:monoamine oxidase